MQIEKEAPRGFQPQRGSVQRATTDSNPIRPAAAGFLVQDWRSKNSNTLIAVLDLVLPSGLVLKGCTYHQRDEKRWIGLPATRFILADGKPSDWINVIDFVDRKTRWSFQQCALAAIDEYLAAVDLEPEPAA